MGLREVATALRAAWWLPLVGLLVGGAAGFLISVLQTPLYASSLQLFVATTESTSTSDAYQGSQFSQQRVTSYARLIAGEDLAERVISRLELDRSPPDLTDQVTAAALPETVLLDVTVRDPSAEGARRIAEAIGEEFPQLVTELETTGSGGASPVKVTVTDSPEVAVAASSPQTESNVALGALLGLVAGGGLAMLRAHLDRSVKTSDDAVEMTGAAVIGTVLRDETLDKQHTIDRRAQTRTAEDYRQLRTNLQFLNVDSPPKVIMVSSALPSEGKTTLVINLALVLADSGRKVTVVEADLRRPKVTRYLGMVGGAGLTNVLAGTAELDEITQFYGDGRLAVVGAGPTPPNPGELLASHHMQAVIDKLRGQSEYVLVDAPPLLPVADSSGLAVMMDGVLLSVRYGSTTKDQLRQAAATLDRVGATTLGVILNIVPPKAQPAAAYGYGYSYDRDPKHASM